MGKIEGTRMSIARGMTYPKMHPAHMKRLFKLVNGNPHWNCTTKLVSYLVPAFGLLCRFWEMCQFQNFTLAFLREYGQDWRDKDEYCSCRSYRVCLCKHGLVVLENISRHLSVDKRWSCRFWQWKGCSLLFIFGSLALPGFCLRVLLQGG